MKSGELAGGELQRVLDKSRGVPCGRPEEEGSEDKGQMQASPREESVLRPQRVGTPQPPPGDSKTRARSGCGDLGEPGESAGALSPEKNTFSCTPRILNFGG